MIEENQEGGDPVREGGDPVQEGDPVVNLYQRVYQRVVNLYQK